MVDYSNIPRDSRRVPLETGVQFKFDRFSGFISEVSSNISPGGMFIRTHAPQPPGTVLDLEFRLGDGFELIKGRGEVVWNRFEDEGSARPAGMGIRFLELSDGSKDLIYRIVDQHVLQGGTPFDLTQRPPDLTPPPAPAAGPRARPAPSPPAAEPFPELLRRAPAERLTPPAPMFSTAFGTATARPPRRLLPWLLLAVGLALAAGAFLLGERLPVWMGIGEEDPAAQAAPRPLPRRPAREPAAPESSPSAPAGDTASRSATTAAAAPATADAGPPLTQLDRITWTEVPAGTEVVLWGNGAISPAVYTRTRIDGNPPRELIRLSGIRRPYPETRSVVGTSEVLQVRVGYHPETGQGELHVVLDLAHPTVAVTGIEAAQQRLRILLQRK